MLVDAFGGVRGQRMMLGCGRDGELVGVPFGRDGGRSDRGVGFEVAVMARAGVWCMQLSSDVVDGVGETRTVRSS